MISGDIWKKITGHLDWGKTNLLRKLLSRQAEQYVAYNDLKN
jgi:hypothetical protein